MGVIYDVSRFIPHLVRGHYAELNETSSSLCSTQCLSNMPIGRIDRLKIYRSRDRLPKPHFDKSSRVSVGAQERSEQRMLTKRSQLLKKWELCFCLRDSTDDTSVVCPISKQSYQEVHKISKADAKTEKGTGAQKRTHWTTGDVRAHAHSLMRDFLTFLHVPLENIDESPFKNNSCLVGSLNDLQLFHQHIIITFIMWDCCSAWGRPFSTQ